METVLVTSGFAPAVLTALRRQWNVVDLPRQRDALDYLQQHSVHPASIVIGKAVIDPADDDLDARTMLAEILKLDANLPVIVSTKASEPMTIVELTKRGAHDYLIEPAQPCEFAQLNDFIQRMMLSISRAVQFRSLLHENQQLKARQLENLPFEFVQPVSSRMQRVLEMACKVAPTPATVLITGESGTGKELLARLIHERSQVGKHPFTAINCGAMNDQLLSSELFGHLKGAFTGAESTRSGLIQDTGAGTLFMDEVGTISPAFQISLLRVLEARTARPVGGSREFAVQCRFVAAANQDLERLVRENRFREDLWYRLNVFRIDIPPLRDRREDIPALCQHYLRMLGKQYGKPIRHFAPAAMQVIEDYSWPGNVRQLRNTIERAVIVAEKDAINLTDLDPQIQNGAAAPVNFNRTYKESMRVFERNLISAAISSAGGNLTRAAEILQIKRTTLGYRMRQLDLSARGSA